MVTYNTLLVTGVMVGFSVAVPIGPMGLLCIQRTVASGMRVGVCTGLGAATVNVIYGLVVTLGVSHLAPLLGASGRFLNVAGGLFLLWSAMRTARRGQGHTVSDRPSATPVALASAYGSAIAFNLGNPLAPMLILALLSPVLGSVTLSSIQTASLLGGMFLAASCWWVCLSGAVSLLRARLSPGTLVVVNQAASFILTLYGLLALGRAAGLQVALPVNR